MKVKGMGADAAPLQAILLADTFATHFLPMSLQRPKVLLPLVNSPMIDYTLSWLQSAHVVEEVYVFCCAHSKQVIHYLKTSNWFQQPNFTVTIIESHNSTSVGDALRFIYEKNVIHGDFVLVTGDTVTNMSLTQAWKEHNDRRRKDTNAVMTMVIKRSKPSHVTRQSRLGTEELFMGIDHDTNQLVYYEDRADESRTTLTVDKTLLGDNGLSLHNDMLDCYIDICSPEVLSLFMDNFDYQHLRHHFVKGLLIDDIMGYKIFTHEIRSSYAARVEYYRSYDTISKDIMQGWTYPFVPNVQFSGNRVTKLERQGIYRASDVELSRSAQIGPYTVIGSGTKIGNCSEVSNSVIGESCIIGSNVSIEGCYIWNNVTIEDGCKLKHAIACDGVVMKSGSVLEAGVVLSFKVVVGSGFVVPAYSKVSLLQQPIKQDSGITDFPSTSNTSFFESSDSQLQPSTEIGNGGVGFIWSVTERRYGEEWRHSPIPADKIAEYIKQNATDEIELLNQDFDIQPPSRELEVKHNSIDTESDEEEVIDTESDEEEVIDDSVHFQNEVEETFLRAAKAGNKSITDENVILEVQSLRFAYNKCTTACGSALFYSVMKLALDTRGSPSELLKTVAYVVGKWKKLLKFYLATIDDEIEVISKFEDMCLESSTKEYSNIFLEIINLLYTKDILQEESILNWASEKEYADESDRIFVKQAEKFLRWLKEAQEEEED